jgi:hypothetical protein
VQKHPAQPVTKRQEKQIPGARTAPAGIEWRYHNDTKPTSECSGKIRKERGDHMPRGRKPLIALSEAKHIAEKRGETRHFRHEPDMICTFVIYMIGLVAHVRVRRVERIRITAEWLEREAAVDLATLRFIVSSPEISRELWIYTPKGLFRFFRVLADSVAELDRNGQLMPDQMPVPHRRRRPAAPAPDGNAGNPESAPGSPGSAAMVPVFLLPACTSESVDPTTVSIGENLPPGE